MGCKIKSVSKDSMCYNKCCYECNNSSLCFSKSQGCLFFLDLEFNFCKGSHKKCMNYKEENLKMDIMKNTEQSLRDEQQGEELTAQKLESKPEVYSSIAVLKYAMNNNNFIMHFLPTKEGEKAIYSTDTEFEFKRGVYYTIEQPLITIEDILANQSLCSGALLVISNLVNEGKPFGVCDIGEVFRLCGKKNGYELIKSLRFFPKADNNKRGEENE